ncbi:DNA polymerase eta [Strongyloides ratti]|uniref:DNA polymerase eta n=1 Tax=Strongyloides ratti TaxID=34506 RepID=A0A090L5W9_STRRB|nr:DNA polymerase eta [Strongyloides ratti]CEF65112.1 DNA polymerase eta [Strongyloides ratti]
MSVTETKYHYIGLLDVDAFFAQAEQVLDPSIRGKPVVVLQSTQYGDGQVIACSYEAKNLGIKRGMNKNDLKIFNGVQIRRMPLSSHSNSSDRTKYEMESVKIFNVIKENSGCTIVEKASIDEMYLDMTEHVKNVMKNDLKPFINEVMQKSNIFDRCFLSSTNDEEETMESGKINLMERFSRAVDEEDNDTLAFYVAFVEAFRLRMLIKEKTNYETSVGVSYSKKIAKYVCKRHRPFAMTIMLPEQFSNVYGKAKIVEITGFGGILGKQLVEKFNIETINELDNTSDYRLYDHFTVDEVKKIRKIVNGSLDDEVKARSRNSDVSCSKTFRNGLNNLNEIMKNLMGIAKDLHNKLKYEKEQGKRVPTSFAFYHNIGINNENALMKRKSLIMNGVDYENYLPKIALEYLKQSIPDFGTNKIFVIGFTASKFEDTSSRIPITAFFSKVNESRKRKLDVKDGWNDSFKEVSNIKNESRILSKTTQDKDVTEKNVSSKDIEVIVIDSDEIVNNSTEKKNQDNRENKSDDFSDDEIQVIGFVNNISEDKTKKNKLKTKKDIQKLVKLNERKENKIQKGQMSILRYTKHPKNE